MAKARLHLLGHQREKPLQRHPESAGRADTRWALGDERDESASRGNCYTSGGCDVMIPGVCAKRSLGMGRQLKQESKTSRGTTSPFPPVSL